MNSTLDFYLKVNAISHPKMSSHFTHPLCASVDAQQNSDSTSCQQMTDYFVQNLTYRIEELTLGKLDVMLIVYIVYIGIFGWYLSEFFTLTVWYLHGQYIAYITSEF